MLTQAELRGIARERLKDARVLLRAGRYDGAVYLAGYVVEIALKARVCQTLKWSGFPETSREWEPFRSLKTHSFDTLLLYTGIETRIRANLSTEWSVVKDWSPEDRYGRPGSVTANDAKDMIDAVGKLVRVL